MPSAAAGGRMLWKGGPHKQQRPRYAVPRMQRPGPPDARRMPLSEDGTGAWIPPAHGRNPRPLMRRMCYNGDMEVIP